MEQDQEETFKAIDMAIENSGKFSTRWIKMAKRKCTRCERKAHYLRPLPFNQNENKFCSRCYPIVEAELCIEADEKLLRYAMWIDMSEQKVYRYRIGQIGVVRTLRDGVSFDDYLARLATKGETAIKCKPPSIETLMRWATNGICKTPDGCRVEPDGHCPHGFPSWLIVRGLI